MKKIAKASIGLAAVAAVAATGAFVAFGKTEGQKMFDWNDLTVTDVYFNSYENNPVYGNEADFVTVAEHQDYPEWSRPFNGAGMVVTDGGTYTVKTFVHNDAKSVGDSLEGKRATGVKVQSGINLNDSLDAFNEGYSTTQSVLTLLTADGGAAVDVNGNRLNVISDQATFRSENGKAFKLNYVPGSAKYWYCKEFDEEKHKCLSVDSWPVDDGVINGWENLGYTEDDGIIPGCTHYAGELTYDVVAEFEQEKNPGLKVEKKVAIIGEDGKSGEYFTDGIANCDRGNLESCEKLAVKAGDNLRFKFEIENTGDTPEMIHVIDDLSGLDAFEYIENSTVYKAGNDGRVSWSDADGKITDAKGITTGIILNPGAGMYVAFDVHVKETAQKDCVENLNNNAVIVSGINTDTNEIDITVTDDVTVTIPSEKICTTGSLVDKMVYNKEEGMWREELKNAHAGDVVEYRVRFWNVGNIDLHDVNIDDSAFPKEYINYISGSASWEYIDCDSNEATEANICRSASERKTLGDDIINGGQKFDTIEGGKTIAVYFKGTIDNSVNDLCEDVPAPNKVIAKHSEDQNGMYDIATVYIDAPECHVEEKDFTIRKEVQKDGDTDWSEKVVLNGGDTVRYQLIVKNTGNTAFDIVVTDELVKDLTFDKESLEIQGSSDYEGNLSDGITFKNVPAGTEIYIRFKATVNSKLAEECDPTPVPNTAKATADGKTKEDDAQVVAEGKVCKDTPLPETGSKSMLTATLGAASLATASAYYIVSRKKLN